MAFSKSKHYSKEDQVLCEFLKAIGHPARHMILRHLARKGPCKAMSILKNHPISEPAVSQHLQRLNKVNLVTYKEEFPHTYYSLNTKTAEIVMKLVKSFFKELE